MTEIGEEDDRERRERGACSHHAHVPATAAAARDLDGVKANFAPLGSLTSKVVNGGGGGVGIGRKKKRD